MKRLLLLFLLLSTVKAYSQQIVPIQVKMKAGGFAFDSTSFRVVKVIDQRKDQLGIGKVYGGILNLAFPTIVKKGMKDAYERFFYKGLKNTIQGNRELVISFRDLVYTHESLEAKTRKEIVLKIAVDYYENDHGELSFLFTDKDSTTLHHKYDQKQLSLYSQNFFKNSLQKVDDYLLSTKPFSNTPQKENSTSDTLTPASTPKIFSNIINTDEPSNQLKSLDSLPEVLTRPKNHHLSGVEKFEGSSAIGYRFRYVGFARDWDDFDWKPAMSIDIEGFGLQKEFSNISVFYSYFALGVGTIKPLNNYLFLDLNAKIGIGSEIIDNGIFSENERNTIFGLFFNQRIHLMVGKGFGVFVTGGIYENLFGGAKYIKTDVGFILGGGIKF